MSNLDEGRIYYTAYRHGVFATDGIILPLWVEVGPSARSMWAELERETKEVIKTVTPQEVSFRQRIWGAWKCLTGNLRIDYTDTTTEKDHA